MCLDECDPRATYFIRGEGQKVKLKAVALLFDDVGVVGVITSRGGQDKGR